MLKQFDTDESGDIQKQELVLGLTRCGIEITIHEVQMIWPTLCSHGDGISFDDWEQFLGAETFNIREVLDKLNRTMMDEGKDVSALLNKVAEIHNERERTKREKEEKIKLDSSPKPPRRRTIGHFQTTGVAPPRRKTFRKLKTQLGDFGACTSPINLRKTQIPGPASTTSSPLAHRKTISQNDLASTWPGGSPPAAASRKTVACIPGATFAKVNFPASPAPRESTEVRRPSANSKWRNLQWNLDEVMSKLTEGVPLLAWATQLDSGQELGSRNSSPSNQARSPEPELSFSDSKASAKSQDDNGLQSPIQAPRFVLKFASSSSTASKLRRKKNAKKTRLARSKQTEAGRRSVETFAFVPSKKFSTKAKKLAALIESGQALPQVTRLSKRGKRRAIREERDASPTLSATPPVGYRTITTDKILEDIIANLRRNRLTQHQAKSQPQAKAKESEKQQMYHYLTQQM